MTGSKTGEETTRPTSESRKSRSRFTNTGPLLFVADDRPRGPHYVVHFWIVQVFQRSTSGRRRIGQRDSHRLRAQSLRPQLLDDGGDDLPAEPRRAPAMIDDAESARARHGLDDRSRIERIQNAQIDDGRVDSFLLKHVGSLLAQE